MKKLSISLIAVLVALPTMANAENIAAATKANIAANTNVATTSFVGGAHDHLVDEINTNRTAINTLNGDVNTTGSVAKAVADGVAGKQDTIDSTHKVNADYIDDSTSTNKFVTASDITAWNAKQDAIDAEHKLNGAYITDSSIAKSQLNTALQSEIDSKLSSAVAGNGLNWNSGTNKMDAKLQDNSGLAVDSTGIALSAATKSALELADSALQSADLGSGITWNSTNSTFEADVKSVVDGDTNGAIKVNGTAITVYDDTALASRVTANESAISSHTTDISALQTAVGDASSGLVKDVNALKSTVGDNTAGLVKDVNDLDSRIDDLEAANSATKGFNVYGNWSTPDTSTGTVTVTTIQ